MAPESCSINHDESKANDELGTFGGEKEGLTRMFAFVYYRALAFAVIVIWRVYLPFPTLRSMYSHGQMSSAGGSSKDRYDASVEVEADVVHFRFGCGRT
ncbi:hypothetical protein Maqu_3280 [Marinobacter nauticus VT8]|uniref:Uncharacterized protein n=1 Tax=Marinobacter nauticus (strain ATCC 700491 / DSM 11845 / VT8) TaxID=351348 RepID=A1U5T2_MARN8|nr:hypothetical protein Maqu_3280 [Marinobacter nauticus VT8]